MMIARAGELHQLAVLLVLGLFSIPAPGDSLSLPFSNLQSPPPPVEISTGALRDVLSDPSPKVEVEQTVKQLRPASSGLGAVFPVGEGIHLETALGGRMATTGANSQEGPGRLPGAELTGFGLALKLAASSRWQLSIGYRRDLSLYPNDGAVQQQASGVPQDSLFFGIWHSF